MNMMRWRIALSLALFVSNAGARADAYECAVVKLPRGNVVLFAKPATSSPIIARLQDPQLVLLDEGGESSEWLHVTIEGKEDLKGWVKGNRVHSKSCG
jgi:hypothetical protein